MKKLQRYFFYLVGTWCVICLFIRCYTNLAGMQTGRTVGAGKAALGGSYMLVHNSPTLYGDDEPPTNYLEDQIKVFEFDARFGVSKRTDLGLNISSQRMGLNAKINLIGNDGPFALSIGAGGGLTGFHGYVQGNLFASLHPAKKLAFYCSPSYAHINIGENSTVYNVDKLRFKGANFGVLYGDKVQIGLDYGRYSLDLGKEAPVFSNIGVGLKFILGKNGTDKQD